MKHFFLETLSFPSFLPASSDIPSSLLLLGFLFLMKVALSCPTLCNPMNYSVHGISQARILEWVVFLFSRGIFPTQRSNPSLPHCRQVLYQLSHQGSPRILEWVAYPFSSRSSWPRNRTGISSFAGDSLPAKLPGKPHSFSSSVAQSCPILCDPMNCSTSGLPVHHQLPETHSDSHPSSRWCHPTISSSVVPFSSCLQSFPASGSFPMSQL